MPETALTSALNATIITGNGNEGLLLNDMGNTLIKDSITGNIMSLSNGFIPLGMKERGGILYIASYNPQTKEGELGTIPSPIIAYTYNKSEEDTSLTISDIKSSDTSEETLVDDRLYKSQIYILSDHIFHGGDKFIVILNLDLKDLDVNKPKTTERKIVPNKIISGPADPSIKTINFPQITNSKNRGWFKIKLLALGINGEDPKELTSITSEAQEYYTTSGKKTSEYWFISSDDIASTENFNLNKTRTSGLFRTFPNIQSGRLAIQFEVEKPEQLEYLYNIQYNKNLPQLIAIPGASSAEYYAAVHGFQYNGNCAILPDKIKVKCNFPIYLSRCYASGTYSIDISKSFNDIIIYPQSLPDVGTENNNSGVIKTDYTSSDPLIHYLPATIEEVVHAYLSNISDDKFIISRYRHPSNILFENYTTNNDALFFIKLDSFDKDIEIGVDLYTKGFILDPFKSDIQELSYVKYDSYNLPAFNPMTEEGLSDIDRKSAQQALIIENPLSDVYDFELFNDVASGENACFVCTDENLENDIILTYDWRTRTYQANPMYAYTLGEYANLKTWVYPITAHTAANTSYSLIRGHVTNQYHFLWWYNVKPHHDTSSYGYGALSDTYLTYKLYLLEDGNDGLPTYKLPALPTVSTNDIERPLLIPLLYKNGNDGEFVEQMFERARNAKTHSRLFVNKGLTVDEFKKYCLFDNNLTCFDSPILSQPFGAGLYCAWWNARFNTGWERKFQIYEEEFLLKELKIFDTSDIDITSINNLPVVNTFLKIRCDDISDIYSRYSLLLLAGCNPSNIRNSLIEGLYRPYLLGSTQIHLGYKYNFNISHESLANTSGAGTPMIGHQASFITFLAKSTPGYIPCNTDYNLINLHLFKQKFSLKYLYDKNKTKLSATFINKGRSTVTLNYLNYLFDGEDNFSSYAEDGYMWYGLRYFYIDNKFINDWAPAQLPFNLTCTFNTSVDGFSSNLETINTKEYFIDYTSKNVSALGVGTSPVSVDISNELDEAYVKTNCNISINDGFGGIEYEEHLNDEDLILTGDDIRNRLGKVYGWDMLNLKNTVIKHIELTNVLTTSRAKLFVDKSQSNLSYINKSDYSIDYLLLLKNNYGIHFLSGGIPTQTVSNIDTTNLLVQGEIGDVETMLNLGIDFDNSTINLSSFINSSHSYIGKNSFLDEPGYLPGYSIGTSGNILFKPINVSSGWYVFNINYNYPTDYNIALFINGGNVSKLKLSENKHLVAFYIPSSMTITLNLSFNHSGSGSKFYIKNCGLYKVNDMVLNLPDDSSNIKIETYDSNPELISKIVLPGVFSFKEQYSDDDLIGCIDQTYDGFLALPDRSYQQLIGVYRLNKDNETAALWSDTIPAELPVSLNLIDYIQRNIFKNDNLQIRHSV